MLKNGKASGIDMISYEMLKCIIAYNPNILLKVFNCVLQLNLSISEWFVSIITPIHKKGPKMDPDNYRGISLHLLLVQTAHRHLKQMSGKIL